MTNYLQLAEGTPAANINRELLQYYVPVATKRGTKLMREDVLDDLSDAEWHAYMDAIEYSGFSFGGKKRQARIERRQARKDEIAAAKAKGIEAGTYEPASKGIISDIITTAGSVVGGKLKGAGAGAAAADTTPPPATNKTIYYVGGAVLILGLGYMLLKPKHH